MCNSGFILINKNSGPTSHDLVAILRKITNIKKIGHAGTLDPFASGLMILAIGRESTKQISNFVKLDKKYKAKIKLGESTDTMDRCGSQIFEYKGQKISETEIKKALKIIKKQTSQIAPMYSAKKIKGQKLYQLARKGIEIKREPHEINIFEIKILDFQWPFLNIEIHCSSGTYIRSIAHDLGLMLKCGAYLEELQRIQIGKHHIKDSHNIEDINNSNWSEHLFTQ